MRSEDECTLEYTAKERGKTTTNNERQISKWIYVYECKYVYIYD